MNEAAAAIAPTATLEEQAERISGELAIPSCPAILGRLANLLLGCGKKSVFPPDDT